MVLFSLNSSKIAQASAELELKKWVFCSGRWIEYYRFLVTSGCPLSGKV